MSTKYLWWSITVGHPYSVTPLTYALSDLPQAVEEYAHRVAPAIANNYSKAGVVVNFVTATGGDVEMLRSIECFYKYAIFRIIASPNWHLHPLG